MKLSHNDPKRSIDLYSSQKYRQWRENYLRTTSKISEKYIKRKTLLEHCKSEMQRSNNFMDRARPPLICPDDHRYDPVK